MRFDDDFRCFAHILGLLCWLYAFCLLIFPRTKVHLNWFTLFLHVCWDSSSSISRRDKQDVYITPLGQTRIQYVSLAPTGRKIQWKGQYNADFTYMQLDSNSHFDHFLLITKLLPASLWSSTSTSASFFPILIKSWTSSALPKTAVLAPTEQ